ncbi:SIMPL domain-containing protein [Marinobacterium rhizophilum]|uniref:SIMPL domain-containing protein n=1 Tax=Marinobacterium rhizophilum TaxID=420402 RepID=A0ABY5HPJ6_9GAMM|nr:SIMPL domain-containing protein [Marinobacterium rhizophilum]UTW13889.1 SIMPL domain-containing protein [Marinobacterium rhizophilum]
MNTAPRSSALLLGICILLGLASLGYLLGEAALRVKETERRVTVKGLSEREYPADVVLWPIQFSVVDNDLSALYRSLQQHAEQIRAFLLLHGVEPDEISLSPPAVIDKQVQQYGDGNYSQRFSATQTVTVYSSRVDQVRPLMQDLAQLGQNGIALTGSQYGNSTEYLFNRLNEVKPGMVEEATREARAVAEKFAADSNSRLGKIRSAQQGQFSISDRDRNSPHIKKLRVVSTVEYYLSD